MRTKHFQTCNIFTKHFSDFLKGCVSVFNSIMQESSLETEEDEHLFLQLYANNSIGLPLHIITQMKYLISRCNVAGFHWVLKY